MGWMVQGSNPGKSKRFFPFSKTHRPALWLTQLNAHGVKLIAYLRLASRLRMSGAILLPPYVFTVYTGRPGSQNSAGLPDQALVIHCSVKNFQTIRHVLSITAFCVRMYSAGEKSFQNFE